MQKWYNQLIEKTIAEITVEDVLRMIRQKEFTNLAVSKAINFLKEDVFVVELYEGELLEKLSEMDRQQWNNAVSGRREQRRL